LQDAEPVRGLTSAFNSLRGLIFVPLGLYLLLGAGWWSWYEVWEPISGGLALIVLLISVWLVNSYYSRSFGEVEDDDRGRVRKAWILGSLPVALLVSGMWDGITRPSISVFGLTIAAFILLYAWATVGLRVRYIAVCVLVVGVSFLQVLGIATYEQTHGVVLPVVLGTSLIVVGLVDHALLVRRVRIVRSKVRAQRS